MYKIATAPAEEREILFQNTAAKLGMNAAIIEKDFWVCITLDYLFHNNKWKNHFAFKGGTSLSKVYNLIDRFSEDIDLILDWRVIGYSVDEPWAERSNIQQQKFIASTNVLAFHFLKNEFLPVFQKDMSLLLNQEIYVRIEDTDPGTVKFQYPRLFNDGSILQEIRLEIGVLAAWTPTQSANIKSYVAEQYPQIFTQSSTSITVTTAARTFWEKATILHQEAYRPDSSLIPERYSRHYYDLYCMKEKGVLAEALQQSYLLKQVADFKAKFYPRKWAHYELAEIQTIRLYPAEHSLPRLRSDYNQMRDMIYGNYPDFDFLMSEIKQIEEYINTYY